MHKNYFVFGSHCITDHYLLKKVSNKLISQPYFLLNWVH